MQRFGSTFTITNPGPFGTYATLPIINQPQVAILSIDGVKKNPVVIESDAGDSIAIRPVGVLATHEWAPRVLIANANLVPGTIPGSHPPADVPSRSAADIRDRLARECGLEVAAGRRSAGLAVPAAWDPAFAWEAALARLDRDGLVEASGALKANEGLETPCPRFFDQPHRAR